MRTRLLVVLACGLLIFAACSIAFISGWWIPNFPDQKEYPIRGIDVSAHQGHIEWQRVAGSGIRFVYLKATEGGDFQDKAFAENLRGAREAGLACGAYHFFRLGTPGREQAMNFIHTVPKQDLALPPAIDLEFWGNSAARPAPDAFQTQLSIFTDALAKSGGKAPVLYVGSDFASVYFASPSSESKWIRNIFLNPVWNGNKSWLFWQFSDRGQVPGIDGFVDMDVFNGTADRFAALTQKGAIP